MIRFRPKVRLFGALFAALIVVTGVPAASAAQRPGEPGAAATRTAFVPSAYAPSFVFTNNAQLSTHLVPINVSWPEAAPDNGQIARYELQRSLDGGPWVSVPLSRPLSRSITLRVPPWAELSFRVRAVDTAEVASDWAESAPAWLSVAQEKDPNITLSTGWNFVSDAYAYGKGRATTTTAGSSATFTFTGRQVAWIARVGPSGGKASIAVDGEQPVAVDLYRSSASSRRIVFRRTWPTAGPHTLSLTTTSAGENVVIDAFIVATDAGDATLVGAGDIASCAQARDSQTAALVQGVLDADPTASAFTVGDNVYPNGSTDYFNNCYHPTWGAFRARTRPGIGNHEFYQNPGAAGYFAYFGESAGTPGQGWYKFQAGTWRIYALSSECRVSSTCYNAQLEWLNADLAAEPHRCVMAMWHRPVFSTGSHGSSGRMINVFKLLYDNGADVVIAGHDHGYQRFAPADVTGTPDPSSGMREFVVGTGGASLYAWKTDSTLLEVRDNNTHGVLRLDLSPGAYSWQFLPVPGPSGFTDSGTAACH